MRLPYCLYTVIVFVEVLNTGGLQQAALLLCVHGQKTEIPVLCSTVCEIFGGELVKNRDWSAGFYPQLP